MRRAVVRPSSSWASTVRKSLSLTVAESWLSTEVSSVPPAVPGTICFRYALMFASGCRSLEADWQPPATTSQHRRSRWNAPASPRMIWHKETDLAGLDLIVIPGGFSFGDYLRCGAMAAHSPVMSAIRAHAERGSFPIPHEGGRARPGVR
jgi:hypothetical protein